MYELSTQKRITRDRIKSMITHHLLAFPEIRFTEWCKLNRISPTNFGDAMAELVREGRAKRGGFYLVAGLRGYESFQVFVAGDGLLQAAEEAVEVHPNIRFLEMTGTWGTAA